MKNYIVAMALAMAVLGTQGLSPSPAYAQEQGAGNIYNGPGAGNVTNTGTMSGGIPTLGNPLRAKSVTSLLYSIIDILIFIGTIVAVFMFIFVGFKFVMAQGSDTKLAEAKGWFFNAVIGTAILISSKVIVEVIKATLISTGIVNQDLWP